MTSPTPNLADWEVEKASIERLEARSTQPGGRDWQREDLYDRQE